MRKRLALVLLVSLLVALMSPIYAAVPKAGASCSKAGSTSVYAGKKYTCIKSGKKLIWNKGVAIAKPAPTPTPTASPTATPTASPTATPTASPTATPTPTPSVQTIIYSVQWSLCDVAALGHDGWVIGMNANKSEFTYLRCTLSKKEDGSPTVVWQIPEDAAQIDQSTKLPISGSGYIPSSTPTPTPNSIDVPTRFTDLYAKRDGISYSIWSKINSKMSQNDVQLPPIEIYRGPNTPIYVEDPSIYFKQIIKLFPGINLPKKIVVFYWTNQDKDVVAAKALSIMGRENDQKNYDETTGPWVTCYTTTSCDVGHALIGLDGTAYLGIGIPDTLAEAQKSGGGKGGVEKVEFYHALQLFNYHTNSLVLKAGGQNIQSSFLPPTWLNIGGENLVNLGLSYSENYSNFKYGTRYKDWVNQTIPNFSVEWLNNYLNISNLGKDWSDAGIRTGGANVVMGSFLTEIFVSLKGPSVLLDFHEQMSKQISFADAFQNIFGASWQSAQPEIAKVIYDRYVRNY